MILILGGTTEGRMAVHALEEAGQPFYYSTRGDEQEVTLHHGIRLQGALDEAAMKEFCTGHGIRLLVDAAHPFAAQLHQTVEQVAEATGLPVIRFERIFPPRDETHITWCRDYADATERINQSGIRSLLALTGVQSIARLKAIWQGKVCCHFRILDRDSSRELARRAGFDGQRLCYYHEGEDERILMKQIRPEAILLKESGVSGGFCAKVEAARELGIRIFAICRPDTPATFHCVNGEHGLRRMVERLLPDFYPLRSGLTTGTCATAATVAALTSLLAPDRPPSREFPVVLPDGESILVPAEVQEKSVHPDTDAQGNSVAEARASVIKDAGDDPDITNGMEICAQVTVTFPPQQAQAGSKSEETGEVFPRIELHGGEGVGTVTLPGLGLEVGAAAINETPRRMITDNVQRLLKAVRPPLDSNASIRITVSVPGGEEIARRTFNPRIGVEGGISIIGTSGIVKPFSSEAFVNSIRKSMTVALATGSGRIVINSGAKSEKFLRRYYPDLPVQAFVHYGNFIGETLKIADELKVPRVTLGVMIGKAVKLAEGHLDTHSKHITMNLGFIADMARQAGCSSPTLERIKEMHLARELWDILDTDERQAFCHELLRQCRLHCTPLMPQGELTIVLITEEGEVIR